MKKNSLKSLKNKLIAIFLLCVIVFLRLYFSSTKIILQMGGEAFKSQISNCSYNAVEKCIENKDLFNSLSTVKVNQSGDIVMVESNSLLVNLLAKNLALYCYDFITQSVSEGVLIPRGAFTGIKFLAGFGKKVRVKLASTLSVECKILREFSTAGINQTRQVLSAVIYTEITVFAPFFKEKYDGEIEVVLLDNLIVGKVPSTYLDLSVIGKSQVN